MRALPQGCNCFLQSSPLHGYILVRPLPPKPLPLPFFKTDSQFLDQTMLLCSCRSFLATSTMQIAFSIQVIWLSMYYLNSKGTNLHGVLDGDQ